MNTQSHPINPPSKLVEQWYKEWLNCRYIGLEGYIATQAARWGADQELEACCEWFAQDWSDTETAAALRATRRPKPPSLKKLALKALPADIPGLSMRVTLHPDDVALIRRALEALPDD